MIPLQLKDDWAWTRRLPGMECFRRRGKNCTSTRPIASLGGFSRPPSAVATVPDGGTLPVVAANRAAAGSQAAAVKTAAPVQVGAVAHAGERNALRLHLRRLLRLHLRRLSARAVRPFRRQSLAGMAAVAGARQASVPGSTKGLRACAPSQVQASAYPHARGREITATFKTAAAAAAPFLAARLVGTLPCRRRRHHLRRRSHLRRPSISVAPLARPATTSIWRHGRGSS